MVAIIPLLENAVVPKLAPELIGKRISVTYDASSDKDTPSIAAGTLASYVIEDEITRICFEGGLVFVVYSAKELEITLHTDKLGR